MDQNQTLKQMMQMNKMAFDNSYMMMMSAYEQNKLMFNTYLNQMAGVAPEIKTAIEEWMKAYKNGCEELKKMIDAGYQKVEEHFAKAEK